MSTEVANSNEASSSKAPPSKAANQSEAVIEGTRLVEELRSFRDRYFEARDVATYASRKQEDVRVEVEKTVAELDKLEIAGRDKALLFMLKGKALNVLSEYNSQCQEFLSRAIKHNPKLADAWCQLGECHWKRGDVQSAYNCFKSALDHQVDKHVLRNLSMVLRQLPAPAPEERANHITESVTKAREAVQLDLSDGISWMVLGNAYLSAFFGQPYNTKLMTKCMTAYARAEKDPVAKLDADLHYNWGMAFQYQDEFAQALQQFHLANQLDPTWENPVNRIRELIDFLGNIDLLTKERGKMKEKRFKQLIGGLAGKGLDKELGPFAGGGYKSAAGESISLECVTFDQLQTGSNLNKVVVGKVICCVPSEIKLAFTLILADANGALLPVNIFNIGEGVGPLVGDSMAFPDPFIESVVVPGGTVPAQTDVATGRWAGGEAEISLRLARVPTPDVLAVNGKRVGQRWTAKPVLQNMFFSE